MTKANFIKKVAALVQKYAPDYEINVFSPVIAQAILESGWGKSSLSKTYNNHFGLKCGTAWKGASVNLTTKEEYTPGTHTTIKDDFRAYGTFEEGVKGYFEFIQLARYKNLKGITDPRKYLETIKADGYCTSSTYVENCMKLVMDYNLTQYDPKPETPYYRSRIVSQAQAWVGRKEADGSHKLIIDIYNKDKPLPIGYKVKYNDAWCATFVSACAIMAGYQAIIPKECSCPRQIDLWKKLGRWQEKDTYTPAPGDIIYYDWDDSGKGDNTGTADHVGIVEKVSKNTITVIEGNKGRAVARRQMGVGARYIRGYGLPAYTADKEPENCFDVVTALQEAINKQYAAELKVSGKYDAATKAAVKKHVLKQGMTGQHVKWLQTALNEAGYSLEVDGSFGPLTFAAVCDLHSKQLTWKVTGKCGKKTTKKLITLAQKKNKK